MAETGTIQFRVYTSSANIPVPGATVIIRGQDAPYLLYGVLVTNESGQTPILTVPAPAETLGQTSGSDRKPWLGLRIYIEHPGYETVTFDGVQLFPGVLSVQSIPLIPNQEIDPEEDDLQEYDLSPQPIWEGGSR